MSYERRPRSACGGSLDRRLRLLGVRVSGLTALAPEPSAAASLQGVLPLAYAGG